MDKYLTKDEIVVNDFNNAVKLSKILLEEGNVVMISREEDFWVINWIWDSDYTSDRNKVVFISREDYEYEEIKRIREERKGENI